MRWWPFGRRPADEPAAQGERALSAAVVGPTTQATADPAPSSSVPRPEAEWRAVPPMRTVTQDDPRVMPDVGFRSALPSVWTVPASLAPLGHDVSMSAPTGLLPSLLAPVEGYADAPELRWPSIVEPAAALDSLAVPAGSPRPTPAVIMQEPTRRAPVEQTTDVEVAPQRRPGDGDGPDVAIESLALQHDGLAGTPETDPPSAAEAIRIPAEPDRRRRLVSDLPPTESSSDPVRRNDDLATPSAPVVRSHPAAGPAALHSVVARSPGQSSTPLARPAGRPALEILDAARAASAAPPQEHVRIERLAAPVEPAENPHERDASLPAGLLEATTGPTALGAVVGEAVSALTGPAAEALEPSTSSAAARTVPAAVDRPDTHEDGSPGPVTERIERVVTRTVERAGETPLARVLRPTVGERQATHDFRLRPAGHEEPDKQRTSARAAEADDPWAARSQPIDDVAPEPSASPILDVPGLPADLAWSADETGPGTPGDSLVWDARAAMRFPEPHPDLADHVTAAATGPGVTDEASNGPFPVPALDGFRLRPPRRRRALQVGMPTPRPAHAPAETFGTRQPAMISADLVHDHDEGEGSAEWREAPGAVADAPAADRAPVASSGTGPASTPANDASAMSDELYERIRGRLRQELLIDRERSLLLTDLR